MNQPFKLIVIAGPTAVGKTDIAIKLAKDIGAEIISADSRQIYRELLIGTARPSEEEMNEVKHHLVACKSIHSFYSAGIFEREVLDIIDDMTEKQNYAILAGGSGLYIQAVCEGIDDLPGPDRGIRENLEYRLNDEGLKTLSTELFELDPETWYSIDRDNPKRVLRALEVIHQTGEKYSELIGKKSTRRNFRTLKIGLNLDRHLLYQRINERADRMLEKGLFDEVKRFYMDRDKPALQTVGYSEFFGYLSGKYDYQEAVRLFKRNSRRYAKRQLTWFKKDMDFIWYSPVDYDLIKNEVNSFLSS